MTPAVTIAAMVALLLAGCGSPPDCRVTEVVCRRFRPLPDPLPFPTGDIWLIPHTRHSLRD